ncbi:hypothetical protein SDRG_10955 [Saprolegnia diclina VS20]|uniref:GOLD domain-containing protein n=1 Tax=Saprolegnia diclina (strain VS20) TaxID=1156394 RepID=T0RGE4_SAPDV|nr:hypothetical protein SDRG_10955 [Saprolegnia diclina VS20]EQC31353.1 hypothetical protein SDRG_10955 [Saprolegnia diclina VS20]|eukprot:XP_008615194.1 hypothetical protein SDRG_10955 [Saprolegnia diclina VS20]
MGPTTRCLWAMVLCAAALAYAEETPHAPVILDDFDPYKQQDLDLVMGMGTHGKLAPAAVQNEHLSKFDFDPSEGLTFYIEKLESSCFFEDVKSLGDDVSGAYIVSTAAATINVVVKDPTGAIVFRRDDDVEGTYEVKPSSVGVYEVCFVNDASDGKLVSHVTHTLQSQHPVEKEHVSILAKYASHLDIRLGELESEQRLMQLRTDRHMKTEKSTNDRVSLAGTLESLVYVACVLLQICYIKRLLESPRHVKSWA